MATQTSSLEVKPISGPTAAAPSRNMGRGFSLSGKQDFRFFPDRPKSFLNGHYEIVRMLGEGQLSTTWLVTDVQAPKLTFYAVKILSVHATSTQGDQLEILKKISRLRSQRTVNLPYLYDHFEIEGPHGKHLCLVLPVLSTDISRFRSSAPSKKLPPRTVKIIILQVLRALETLHGSGIIHGGIKPDNVLFSDGTAPETIQKLLKTCPPIVNEESGMCYPSFQPQPVPHPFKWDDPPKFVELYIVQLVGFGNAQMIDEENTKKIGAKIDTKFDIWALGCMTFTLLTGCSLLSPQAGQTKQGDDHLTETVVMQEQFSKTFPSSSLRHLSEEDELCVLDPHLSSLERTMLEHGVVPAEAASAASFIHACSCPQDAQSPSSVAALRAHPWLKKAFMCC